MSEEANDIENEDDGEAPPPLPASRRTRAAREPRDDQEDLGGSGVDPVPFLDRSRLEADFGARGGFDFPGRPTVDLDREINNRNRLYGAVAKLRFDPEAKVTVERVLPETWEGMPTKGYSGEYHVNTFQTAADLLEQIKRTSGGFLYECVFQAPNKGGDMKTMTRVRCHINAPPIVVSGQSRNGNGNGTTMHSIPNPNIEIVGKVMDAQQRMMEQQRKDNDDPRMMAQITNIVREMRASSEATMTTMMKVQQDQIANLTKMLEKGDKPEAGLIKFTSEQAANQINQQQSRFDTEKNSLITAHQQEKTMLVNNHNQLVENLRRDHERALDNLRRDKEAEISRMESRISATENQNAIMKLSLETNYNAQMSNQKTAFETQIANSKSSTDVNMTLTLGRINTLESQVKTLEAQRDQLLAEKITDAKNRPDSLSAMAGTMAAVKELAGAMGLQKPEGGPEEPQMMTMLKGLKELGVGETLGRIADKFSGGRQQQQQPMTPVQQIQQQGFTPMGTFNVPVNAQGVPLMSPQQAFGAGAPPPQFVPPQQTQPVAPMRQQVNTDNIPSPQSHSRAAAEATAAAPAPQAQPQGQPAASPAPQQKAKLPELPPEVVRPVAGMFERAMTEQWPIRAFAVEIVRDLGPDILTQVVEAGCPAFLEAVEKAVPDSDLVSVKGTGWLQQLFAAVAEVLSQPPPAAS